MSAFLLQLALRCTTLRRPAALALAALLTGFGGSARAEDTASNERRALAARERGLAHTIFELGAGIVALPAAEICPTSLDSCKTGEVGLGLGLRSIYQFGDYGLGAGIQWGTTLRNDEARGQAELEREHTRRYFHVEAMFRYTFASNADAEGFLATTLGLVSVLDEWQVDADRNPVNSVKFVGPQALAIGTEGMSATLGMGGHWFFADNFSLGGLFRYGNWILPFEAETSPVGDVASLSGRVDVFDLALNVAYRLSL